MSCSSLGLRKVVALPLLISVSHSSVPFPVFPLYSFFPQVLPANPFRGFRQRWCRHSGRHTLTKLSKTSTAETSRTRRIGCVKLGWGVRSFEGRVRWPAPVVSLSPVIGNALHTVFESNLGVIFSIIFFVVFLVSSFRVLYCIRSACSGRTT